MPERGAANCWEGPGCGSVGVRPVTAAHSSFSLLHWRNSEKPTDLNPEGPEVLIGSAHWTTPDLKKCLWLVAWGVRGGVLLPVCAKLRSSTQVPDDYSSFIMGMTSDAETLFSPRTTQTSVSPMMLNSSAVSGVTSVVSEAGDTNTGSFSSPGHHLICAVPRCLRVQLAVPSVAALGQASLRPWCWIWSMLRFA